MIRRFEENLQAQLKLLVVLFGLMLAIGRASYAEVGARHGVPLPSDIAAQSPNAGASPARGRPQGSPLPARDAAAAHLGAGYENLRNSRYEPAAQEFRAALALNPKLVLQARFPLGVSLFELHQTEAARREFEAVRRETGDHPNLQYYLGRIDLAEGQVDAAIRELSRAAVKPPFPDTAYYLGSAYLQRHDLTQAEKWLRRAAELAPRDAAVQYTLGKLYSQTGNKDEAQRAYALSEQLRRRDAELDRVRLECKQKFEHGTLEDARPVCDQLFDPDDADKLTILGTIYGEHGDFEAALKPLRRAAELSPNSPQMQYNLALNYFQLGRYAEAKAALAKAEERWPDLFPLNALLGAVLFRLGEESEAYRVLVHAHALNPDDAGAVSYLYVVSLSLAKKSVVAKQYPESLKYLSEAAKLRPQEPEPHRLLAEAYDATGRHAEAAEERRQSERLASLPGSRPN